MLIRTLCVPIVHAITAVFVRPLRSQRNLAKFHVFLIETHASLYLSALVVRLREIVTCVYAGKLPAMQNCRLYLRKGLASSKFEFVNYAKAHNFCI